MKLWLAKLGIALVFLALVRTNIAAALATTSGPSKWKISVRKVMEEMAKFDSEGESSSIETKHYVEQFIEDSKWVPPRSLRPGPAVCVTTDSGAIRKFSSVRAYLEWRAGKERYSNRDGPLDWPFTVRGQLEAFDAARDGVGQWGSGGIVPEVPPDANFSNQVWGREEASSAIFREADEEEERRAAPLSPEDLFPPAPHEEEDDEEPAQPDGCGEELPAAGVEGPLRPPPSPVEHLRGGGGERGLEEVGSQRGSGWGGGGGGRGAGRERWRGGAAAAGGMKLFTHNILESPVHEIQVRYPLGLEVDAADVCLTAYNPEFILSILPRIDWPVLLGAVQAVGGEAAIGVDEPLPTDPAEVYRVLLEARVLEGHLVCPTTRRRFRIHDGIPNFLPPKSAQVQQTPGWEHQASLDPPNDDDKFPSADEMQEDENSSA